MIFVFFLFISFLFEHAFSMCIPISSYLHPLFSIVTLVVISPYFFTRKKEYFLLAFFFGLFYDITYTNTLYLNAFVFLMMAFFLTLPNRFFPSNIFFSFLLLLFSICIYQIVSFLLLCIIGYLPFHLGHLFMGITHCIIANLLYGLVLFFLLKQIDKKVPLKKS